MPKVVYDDPDAMIAWAEVRLACTFRADARAIGLASASGLVAVTVFDTFGPADCHMSVAAEFRRPWLTREYIRHVVAFPFITCLLPRITCMVSEYNQRSIRFTEHMGLTLEGRKRRAGPHGEDWLMYGLLREECRWLPKSLRPRQSPAGAL